MTYVIDMRPEQVHLLIIGFLAGKEENGEDQAN
jgi:hypothetical protein